MFKIQKPWYTGDTGVIPLDYEIKKAVKYGYAHHIVRLMVFMNFFILCEMSPANIYRWFMEIVAIDAYDWVMVSNILAMGFFESNGHTVMHRPYLSSSTYIAKMSTYKKDNRWDVIWDALFYRFVSGKAASYTSFYKRNLGNISKSALGKHKTNANSFLQAHFVKSIYPPKDVIL